jgi:hypothetical protein
LEFWEKYTRQTGFIINSWNWLVTWWLKK